VSEQQKCPPSINKEIQEVQLEISPQKETLFAASNNKNG